MLKKRLIPVLFLKNGLIVRSEGFAYHQNIGNPIAEAKRYSDWNVDELIYVDISRESYYDLRRDDLAVQGQADILSIVEEVSKVCFMPLTFGGGIRNLDDTRNRLHRGADKVTINSIAVDDPDFIKRSSNEFGSQCIIVSIDYKYIDGKPRVFKGGLIETALDPIDFALDAEKRGAGEVFLNSIDRDGHAEGYDIEMIGKISSSLSIPVIGCGGAGSFYDFVDLAEETEVSAIAAGNIFHFTELSYPRAKQTLLKNGVEVRS